MHTNFFPLFLLIIVLSACGNAVEPGPEKPINSEQNTKQPSLQTLPVSSITTLRLPSSNKQFFPSQVKVEGENSGSFGEELAEVKECAKCHPDVVSQWQTSAHAFASFNNPIYRMSVEAIRKDLDKTKSRFCAGCHDIALLVDGAMEQEILPEDRRAHTGVSCRTCHSMKRVTPDGNGSYTLRTDPIPIPQYSDPESILQHKERVAAPVLRTDSFCVSCHRSFLDESTGNPSFLAGMDEFSSWSQSAYAGSHLSLVDTPLETKNCQSCHMPKEEAVLNDVAAKKNQVSSHRFLGGHTWLASMRNDPAQLAKIQKMLQGVASLDIAAAIYQDGTRHLPANNAPIPFGERLIFDVVIRNQSVGHRFPGGTLDAQDTWLEVVVETAKGVRIAEAGTQHEFSGKDPGAHILKAVIADDTGTPLLARETHQFRAPVWNHTLLPRKVSVIQYAFDVPPLLDKEELPVRVVATLRHRSRGLALQRKVCKETNQKSAKEFSKNTEILQGVSLDPCQKQPITEIATTNIWLGQQKQTQTGKNSRPKWLRLYEHGFGLLDSLQERVGEAKPSLEMALALLKKTNKFLEKSMVMAALAKLAIRQGRTDDALSWIDRAEKESSHPALDALRGEAFASVWRWNEAILPWQKAVQAAPKDIKAWENLAQALGSARKEKEALWVSQKGLEKQPRSFRLLRTQALAVKALGWSPSLVTQALEAYLTVRPPDEAPQIGAACSEKSSICDREREPVHLHVLQSIP